MNDFPSYIFGVLVGLVCGVAITALIGYLASSDAPKAVAVRVTSIEDDGKDNPRLPAGAVVVHVERTDGGAYPRRHYDIVWTAPVASEEAP